MLRHWSLRSLISSVLAPPAPRRRNAVPHCGLRTEELETRQLLAVIRLLSETTSAPSSLSLNNKGPGPDYHLAGQLQPVEFLEHYYNTVYNSSGFPPELAYALPSAYTTVNIAEATVSSEAVKFQTALYAGPDALYTRGAASTLTSSVLYQIQANEDYEEEGMETPLNFVMDAIFGAVQFDGSGSGVSSSYALSYRIYRTGYGDLEIESFSGSATVLTGGGLFDRFQRDLDLATQIGDYIELQFTNNATISSSAEWGSEIHTGVTFDLNLTQPPALPVVLSVGAQYNEMPATSGEAMSAPLPGGIAVSADTFGPYLPGVKLDNVFTITVDGPGFESVNDVEWTLGSTSGDATRIGNSNQWNFKLNMGAYQAGTHEFKVTAYDLQGQKLDEFEGEIVHRQTLDFELKVDPGSSDESMAVEDARFFHDVTANLTFEGTVEGLATFYKSVTRVYVGNTQISPTFSSTAPGTPTKFTFTYNTGTLVPGPAGTIGVDLEFGTNRRLTDHFGDQKEPLFSVEKPDWVSNGTISYNSSTGEYQFDQIKAGIFEYTASIAQTGVKWLDAELKQLDTKASLQAILGVHAPLQKDQSAKLNSSQLVAEATLLGNPVWPKTTYTGGSVDFSGTTLDSLTLELDVFSAVIPDQVLAERTFLNESFSIDVAQKAFPGIPSWLLEIEFGVALLVKGSLSVGAGVMLQPVESGLAFVQQGSYINLTAAPSATVTATAMAKVGKGYIAEGSAVIKVTCALDIATRAEFTGTLTNPSIAALDLKVGMTVDYLIKAEATYLTSDEPVTYTTDDNNDNQPDADDKFGPYELLSVNLKKAQKQLTKANKALNKKSKKK